MGFYSTHRLKALFVSCCHMMALPTFSSSGFCAASLCHDFSFRIVAASFRNRGALPKMPF